MSRISYLPQSLQRFFQHGVPEEIKLQSTSRSKQTEARATKADDPSWSDVTSVYKTDKKAARAMLSSRDFMVTARKIVAGEGLCSICKSADLRQHNVQIIWDPKYKRSNYTIPTHWAEPASNDMGFLDEIFMTQDCVFCGLITEALLLSWTQLPLRSLRGERLRCRIPNIADQELWQQARRQFWEIRVCVETMGKALPPGCREIFPATLRLVEADSHLVREEEDEIFQLGKIYPPQHCPAAWYKGLYQTCLRSHGEACEKHRQLVAKDRKNVERRPTATREHTGFRVIDVKRACVLDAPKNCRYVALSYVWGTSEFLHLKKGNQQKLCAEGALLREPIPRTIQEAMSLVLEMEESYLWVDALCIIQDDEHDVSAQIEHMAKIFTDAAFTIVAANGEDVYAGLSGFKPNSRNVIQHSGIIQGLHLLVMGPPLEAILQSVKWNSRAWTYQELILSKRLLIFTPSQVFFICKRDASSEDSAQERFRDHPVYSRLQHKEPKVPWLRNFPGSRTALEIRKIDLINQPKETYGRVVKAYTARSLTHEEDELRAITAFLSLYSEFTGATFLSALPESSLAWALLWQPMGRLRCRKPAKAGISFPSWSWTGWVGPVQMWQMGGDVGIVGYVLTEIPGWKWKMELSDGKQIELKLDAELLDFGTMANQNTELWDHAYEKYIRLHKRAEELKFRNIDSGILVFDTDLAIFTIDCRYFPEKHPELQLGLGSASDFAMFPILVGNLWVGTLILDVDAAERRRGKIVRDAAFIMLSSHTIGFSTLAMPDGYIGPEMRLFDSSLGDTVTEKHSLWGDEYQARPKLYNVMWVDGSEVMARLGIGLIHFRGWEMANPFGVRVHLR